MLFAELSNFSACKCSTYMSFIDRIATGCWILNVIVWNARSQALNTMTVLMCRLSARDFLNTGPLKEMMRYMPGVYWYRNLDMSILQDISITSPILSASSNLSALFLKKLSWMCMEINCHGY